MFKFATLVALVLSAVAIVNSTPAGFVRDWHDPEPHCEFECPKPSKEVEWSSKFKKEDRLVCIFPEKRDDDKKKKEDDFCIFDKVRFALLFLLSRYQR
jgi:hypothetical protein